MEQSTEYYQHVFIGKDDGTDQCSADLYVTLPLYESLDKIGPLYFTLHSQEPQLFLKRGFTPKKIFQHYI